MKLPRTRSNYGLKLCSLIFLYRVFLRANPTLLMPFSRFPFQGKQTFRNMGGGSTCPLFAFPFFFKHFCGWLLFLAAFEEEPTYVHSIASSSSSPHQIS